MGSIYYCESFDRISECDLKNTYAACNEYCVINRAIVGDSQICKGVYETNDRIASGKDIDGENAKPPNDTKFLKKKTTKKTKTMTKDNNKTTYVTSVEGEDGDGSSVENNKRTIVSPQTLVMITALFIVFLSLTIYYFFYYNK